MKTGFFCFLIAVFAGSLALPQSATTAAAAKKKAATKKKAAVKSVKKKTVAGPPRQLTPAPDRYREIQQALADRGYLKSEPNGVWDDQSAEALKQFQTDQHLSPTGKISALSLINLGLGPKPPSAPVTLPGPSALQGSHPPEPTDLPPPPETLPPPEN
jgi:peptidoglycan hydrolase-like protein with peptidoglycan-binding domain